VLAVLGPQWIRVDLRGDLDHLAVLRTWPVSGLTLMSAEVCSSAIVLSALQVTLALLGLIALIAVPEPPLPRLLVLGLAAPAALALAMLNLIALGLQNAGALLYPSWVRVEIRPGGVEAMGQHLLTASASILLLLIAALGPALVGGGLSWLLWSGVGPWAVAPGLLLAAAALGLEAFLLLDWLGGRFERLDPSDLG
ncbi:MAG TPA: hypothetical protein VNH46_03155, partial [Gemmatimonadales bacterium]|nr:hypothetical protein [Gemmatimonadales bacterium]